MTLHKPTGQAHVRLGGRDICLGKFGTPEAESEYRRVLAEWLVTGSPPRAVMRSARRTDLTITELIAAYWKRRQASQISTRPRNRLQAPGSPV